LNEEDREHRELYDKLRIHELLMRYSRGVDRVDAEMVASVFHDEATCEFGELVITGAASIGETITNASGSFALTSHLIGNELIELDGDTARSEAYYFSNVVVEEDGERVIRCRSGRYVDRIERREGVWKIATRIVVEDWLRFFELPETPVGASFRPGKQGLDDPLYDLLGRPA
jgi:hypothetical protein